LYFEEVDIMEAYKINTDANLFSEFLNVHPFGYAYLYVLKIFCRDKNVRKIRELGAFQGASASAFFEGGADYVESVELDPCHLTDGIRTALTELGDWRLRVANSLDPRVDWSPVELTFLDTVHNYDHVANELEFHCQFSARYMAIHDTNYPPAVVREVGELDLGGVRQKLISEFHQKKKVGDAVSDFVSRSQEWSLAYHSSEGSGLMIVERSSNRSEVHDGS
jgi:hypothetical protein